MIKIMTEPNPDLGHNINPQSPCFVLLKNFFHEIFYMQNLGKKKKKLIN
jgi:hypothetical protein